MGAPVSSSAAVSSSTKIYDKRDLNKDGKVTDMEIQQYNIIHPEEKKKDAEKNLAIQNNQAYDSLGKIVTALTGGMVNAWS